MNYNNIDICLEDDGIATVTINRPEVLNALNSETVIELIDAFDSIAEDDDVRGVILTGAGDRAFSAGGDIDELTEKDPISGREFALRGLELCTHIEHLSKPVIAAVNGFALGGGCELALACHLRISSLHALFGQTEVSLGIIPGFGATQRLHRLVGRSKALEMLLSGGVVDAVEAFRIGLINCVIEAYKTDDQDNRITDENGRYLFDREQFLGKVRIMLKGFISKGPIALGYIIEAVNRGLDIRLEEGMRLEADLFGNIYDSEDAWEGLIAYLERCEAKFKGK